MIKIQENILLKDLTTFRIGGHARYFVVVKNEEDFHEIFIFAKSRKLSVFILGGGSNVLIAEHHFSGLVIKNEIKGIKFQGEILTVGAGEILDDIINLSVMRNLSGLENLSGIPGTVGGSVVQNAGAYGVEIKDILLSVSGLNLSNGKKFVLKNNDCQFAYRSSIFKKSKKYIITSVTFKLSKKPIFDINYTGLKKKLEGEANITLFKIREVVLQIRAEKLPDWHKVGTAGSFFKNPIISQEKYKELKEKFLDLPGFPEEKGRVKVSLAWIFDKICELKGYKEGNIGLYDKQPIVLVNFGGATAEEIKIFSEKIKKIVKEKTGIKIEEEVEKVE